MKHMLAALFMLLGAGLLSAADQKIAVIDMDKVFTEYYKTKISDANLKKQADIFRNYAEKLKDSLAKLQDEYKKLRDDSLSVALSETERENKRLLAQDKYRQLMTKSAEIQQYEREKQNHMRDEYEKTRAKLIAEIKAEIQKRCALEGYTIVLDMSGKTLNNIPVVMLSSPSIDITEGVIKELNRGQRPVTSAKDKTTAPAAKKPGK
ncbi:MAG: hypothetical protein A2020_14825 [Lentisphaerae bacterium GWF2_45_14]|nr:MAG: hypothetical protein A2020_14825 [Lentisphaerae bacterium GWF2_45_14]